MCYSARIEADYRRYIKEFDATLSISDFVDLFWWKWSPEEIKRRRGKPNIPKAMEMSFADPQNEREQTIKRYIDEANAREAIELQQELFAQRTRLVSAEAKLAVKVTKSAENDKRIATDKIPRIQGWLTDLARTEPKDRDSRIYPNSYAPVLVVEKGQRVIKPMRYHCLPAGSPKFFDSKFSATYNARRTSLGGFWKAVYGYTHGLMLVERFYEHVTRPDGDGNPNDVVLEFRPNDGRPMLVACLWSRWTAHGEPDLLSFAAITDEPPPEVAAAGHDRCIVPIKAEHVDAWLNPDPSNLQGLDAILDDRETPYYEHLLAA